ncbi:MAG: glycosyltransferase family 2 protein [Bacteroidales bacterium]|nr:glycosyltransferase family 2 protein [Bacteroidales bacterium]
MPKLVSIITPCYNGEKYLTRYFESILSQTYPTVELIFVNDGSTDGTEKMAIEYGEKIIAKGYKFVYFYQKNAGQSAAINQGLKVFSGEYLNWTDSDNYLPAHSIETRVTFLDNHPEAGLVIGRSAVVDDVDYNQIGLIQETGLNRTRTRQLAEDFLKGQMSCTCCCSTMVRSSMFRDAMPDPLQIETPREIGQNYQLFFPIMFKYPTYYIPDMLGYYIVHQDSHSHTRKTFEQKLHIQDVATETLSSITGRLKVDENERDWFKAKIAEYDCKNRLDILQHYQETKHLSEIVQKMKQLGCYDSTAKKMVLKIRYPFIKRLADFVWSKKNK